MLLADGALLDEDRRGRAIFWPSPKVNSTLLAEVRSANMLDTRQRGKLPSDIQANPYGCSFQCLLAHSL